MYSVLCTILAVGKVVLSTCSQYKFRLVEFSVDLLPVSKLNHHTTSHPSTITPSVGRTSTNQILLVYFKKPLVSIRSGKKIENDVLKKADL
jgi:hypothetical protein